MKSLPNFSIVAAVLLLGIGLGWLGKSTVQPPAEPPPWRTVPVVQSEAPPPPSPDPAAPVLSAAESPHESLPPSAPHAIIFPPVARASEARPLDSTIRSGGTVRVPTSAPARAIPAQTAPANFAAFRREAGPISRRPAPAVAAAPPASVPASDQPESVVVELDPGVRLPTALLESEGELPLGEALARQTIEKIFDAEVGGGLRPSADAKKPLHEVWEDAKIAADDRYRLFFGDDAYNRASIRAVLEAAGPSNAR